MGFESGWNLSPVCHLAENYRSTLVGLAVFALLGRIRAKNLRRAALMKVPRTTVGMYKITNPPSPNSSQ